MRAIGLLALLIVGGAAFYGCAGDDAYAQSVGEHYAGRRVYIQSLVYDLRNTTDFDDEGAGGVHIRAKAAAHLTSIEPRVNDSLALGSTIKANETRAHTATSKVLYVDGELVDEDSRVQINVKRGDELAWDYIWLGGDARDRAYCDVDLGNSGIFQVRGSENEYWISDPSRSRYRYSTQNCRIRPPITLTGGVVSDSGIASNLDFSRPSISLSWVDRRRNKGDYVIGGFDVIYPAPTVKSVDALAPVKSKTNLTEDDQGQRLVDPRTVCDFSTIRLLSIGIQSAKSEDDDAVKGLAGLDDDVDYFGGETGRRVAGHISSCLLDPPRNLEVILPSMDVFISEREFMDYNSKIIPVVTTESEDKIDHDATLVIVDRNADGADPPPLATIAFAETDSDDKYIGVKLESDSREYPTARFNIDGAALNYLEKPEGRPDAPDIARLGIYIEYIHAITVERPPLIVTERVSQANRCKWETCSVGRASGGRSCKSGDSCKSRCSKKCTGGSRKWWSAPTEVSVNEYFDTHERVDEDALEFKPGEDESEITYTFTRKVHFEDIFVTFDKPYQSLEYVMPTPVTEFGDKETRIYSAIDEVMGLREGEDVLCSENIGDNWTDGAKNERESPWTYIDGKGCRLKVACCLQAPVEENACGDEISEAEFNCPLAEPGCQFFSDETGDHPATYKDRYGIDRACPIYEDEDDDDS